MSAHEQAISVAMGVAYRSSVVEPIDIVVSIGAWRVGGVMGHELSRHKQIGCPI